MIVLDPKSQFLALEQTAREFGNAANHSSVQTAITYALAEYAVNESPGVEQMKAVNAFVKIFLNLAEKAKALPTFPDKRLMLESTPPTTPPKQ
jgi:1-aminocyclopropane-1-carboxylate deaminase/D-cysteine desulfhydrase-like pyridoxal-dependent ACC family enzyme